MQRLYIEPSNVKESMTDWQRLGLSYTASGYGAKIPSSRMVRVGKRWHRVYVTCYSNAGTAWIVLNKQRVIIYLD